MVFWPVAPFWIYVFIYYCNNIQFRSYSKHCCYCAMRIWFNRTPSVTDLRRFKRPSALPRYSSTIGLGLPFTLFDSTIYQYLWPLDTFAWIETINPSFLVYTNLYISQLLYYDAEYISMFNIFNQCIHKFFQQKTRRSLYLSVIAGFMFL